MQTPGSAVAQTGSTSTPVAADPLRFTLPPPENMSLQDDMDLLECIRVFRKYGGYTHVGSHIPADGPGAEHFHVYMTHLDHPTSIPEIVWAVQERRGHFSAFRVNRALVTIGGGFAGRLLRRWGQESGQIRKDFDVFNATR